MADEVTKEDKLREDFSLGKVHFIVPSNPGNEPQTVRSKDPQAAVEKAEESNQKESKK